MSTALKGENKKKFRIKKTSYGLGLFAKVPFKKKDFVIEYKGEKITNDEADRRAGKYLMTLDKKYTVDGKARTNIARYINHSCRPNCTAFIEGKKLIIRARKTIQPGEEICYDYGKSYYDEYIKPFGCKCDAPKHKK